MKTARAIAELVARDVSTLLYGRAMNSPNIDPNPIQDTYIDWATSRIQPILDQFESEFEDARLLDWLEENPCENIQEIAWLLDPLNGKAQTVREAIRLAMQHEAHSP